ncbi:hypothetical protein K435DRAFT_686141 [Dendrothele bispora CBS 962.96]|uniref:Uncharacterized protein n=1 Tax=Dendrothele bispora (strain CBS 962.96) TaxID=1314807 RepID=A0A4S8LA46_DENBC|nr:hypothetical protein K435DRAFT_686141 [Dendrothele bispora CBS 962.96]
MLMRMKGHNGYRPCRMCNITGVIPPGGRVYYVPLDRSMHPSVTSNSNNSIIKKYHPLNLPLRTPSEFSQHSFEVQSANSIHQSDELSRIYGIKGVSAFSQLSSISFPRSFPHDFMHMVFENNLENLILHWTGRFKDLGAGMRSYEFKKGVWDAIGAATSASGSTIPSCFGPNPPDVANNKQATTADSWCFWLLYIGPVVLREQLPEEEFTHFLQFSKLVELCLQFKYTCEEVRKIRYGFANWVYKYEE